MNMLIDKLLSDYKLGGIIFTIVYVFTTAIFPNIYMIYYEQYKTMKYISLIIWFGIQVLWQLIVIRSIYIYLEGSLNSETVDTLDDYTYKLFVEGGWHNFQRWMTYYAQDIWSDIILISFIFILPIGIFDSLDVKDKLQFIFTKIGLFFIFMFFILGAPMYHISDDKVSLNNYLTDVLEFKGNIKELGYFKYLLLNKVKIVQILLAFGLIIAILFTGKSINKKIYRKYKKHRK